ncbi:MAG: hypothetical protein K1X42_16930 [Opitutaceae bacterium]|nr:hypothetical protein [Opitutaceae bacterium]
MKRLPILIPFAIAALPSLAPACELCSAQQPTFLRGLTHGAGPQGNLDYVIVATALVIVLFALAWAVKCLVRPGERSPDHIKRTILQHDSYGP